MLPPESSRPVRCRYFRAHTADLQRSAPGALLRSAVQVFEAGVPNLQGEADGGRAAHGAGGAAHAVRPRPGAVRDQHVGGRGQGGTRKILHAVEHLSNSFLACLNVSDHSLMEQRLRLVLGTYLAEQTLIADAMRAPHKSTSSADALAFRLSSFVCAGDAACSTSLAAES